MLRTLLLLTVLATAIILQAQERALPRISEELWASFSIQGRPPKFFNSLIGKETRKKFRVAAEAGYRTGDNFLGGRQIYGDGGIRYAFSDLFSLGAEHRYSYRPDQQPRNRTSIQTFLQRTIGRAQIDHRLSYQHVWGRVSRFEDVVRNRITMGYNIPKWKYDPIVSAEFFTWVAPGGLSYIGTRYRAGTKINLKKGNQIALYIMHDRERNVAWPDHRWILAIDYSINVRKL